MHAFLGYFDTFFTPDGTSVAEDTEVDLYRHDERLEVAPKDGSANVVSFTTGPQGVPTHWKQTLFILKEPIRLEKGLSFFLPSEIGGIYIPIPDERTHLSPRMDIGTTIKGTFLCQKSYDINNRELDVEIHYQVTEANGQLRDASGRSTVQLFKVR